MPILVSIRNPLEPVAVSRKYLLHELIPSTSRDANRHGDDSDHPSAAASTGRVAEEPKSNVAPRYKEQDATAAATHYDKMGQNTSATWCCSCFLDCWDPQRSARRSLQKPSGSALSTVVSAASTDVQQPLVVEDESWKKWSSYNLIHDKDGIRRADDTSTQYNPPVFVSHTPHQDAEAVWDL